MSRAKELIKNTGILMAAKISTHVINFLFLPLYTSLLTPEQYGEADIYTSLAMIMIPFLTLQLEMSVFRFYITEKSEINKNNIVTSAYGMTAGVTIIVSLIYFIVDQFTDIHYSVLLFLYYFTQIWSQMLLQTCRAQGDNIGYSIGSLLISSLSVIFNVVFIAVLGWKVDGILISYILAQFVSCAYMILKTKVYAMICKGKMVVSTCKKLLSYSVPLIFNQVSSWAINYSDRLIILTFLGQHYNGIYSIANKFSNITNAFFGIYNITWTENVVRSIDDEDSDKYISKVFEISFSIYMIIVTGILNILPFCFNLLVNNEFRDAYNHIPLLLIGMLFSGMSANIGSIYIAFMKTKYVSITTTLAGVCNVIVHIALLKGINLYAASVSTVVSFIALFIYRYLFVRKFFDLRFSIRVIGLQFLVLTYVSIVYVIKSSVLIIIGLILNCVTAGIIVYINRQNIKKLLKFK